MLKLAADGKICSFCGRSWTPELRFAGGMGAMICAECVDSYHQILHSPRRRGEVARPPWDLMPDQEVLDMLPKIVATSEQVNGFLHDWVRIIRARKISWAEIGSVLGVSRQAAWERFRRTVDLPEAGAAPTGGPTPEPAPAAPTAPTPEPTPT